MLFTDTDQTSRNQAQGANHGYQGTERRLEHRRRLLKGAMIKFNNGFGDLECVVRNLTTGGARISMGQTSGIPTRIQIQIAGERIPVEAKIEWRTPRDIGLRFLLKAE